MFVIHVETITTVKQHVSLKQKSRSFCSSGFKLKSLHKHPKHLLPHRSPGSRLSILTKSGQAQLPKNMDLNGFQCFMELLWKLDYVNFVPTSKWHTFKLPWRRNNISYRLQLATFCIWYLSIVAWAGIKLYQYPASHHCT